MKNIISFGTRLFIVLVIGLMCISCGEDSEKISTESQPTKVPYYDIVLDFIKSDSTYKFDGIDGSIKFPEIESSAPGNTQYSEIEDLEFTVTFKTLHQGHGDRTGQTPVQLIATHNAIIKIQDGQITSAICDGVWDMLTDQALNGE